MPNIFANPLFQAAQKAPKKEKPPKVELPKPPPPPSALESAANLLSLPGSSVRDVLAWKNPFDQWLTPFSNENRTDGRDLLRQYDMAGAENSWGNFGGGLAVDIATDPLSYLGGLGVFTKAGNVASKAGLVTKGASLADDVLKTPRQLIDGNADSLAKWTIAGGTDDLLDKPIKSVLSWRLPKTQGFELSGEKALPIAKLFDKTAEKVMEIPGARELRSAFSPIVHGTKTKQGQELAAARDGVIRKQLDDVALSWSDDTVKNSSLFSNAKALAEDAGMPTAVDDVVSLDSAKHLTRAAGIGHAATELLGRHAKVGGDGVPLVEAMEKLGLNLDRAKSNVKPYIGEENLSSLRVPKELVDDAERLVKPYTSPEIQSTIRKMIETFNASFKSNVTLPFPAFHVRNLVSGQIQNIVKGLGDETQKGPMQYIRPLFDAMKMSNGKAIRGLNKLPEWSATGLTDAEITDLLRSEAYHLQVIDNALPADLGMATQSKQWFTPAPTGATWATAVNPLMPSHFLPTRVGGDVARWTEQANRLAPFIALRKSGVEAAEAARRVNAAQIDYSNLTAWEKKYGRNIVPFFAFSKGMIESTVDDLVKHPGGRLAQTIKAGGSASQDNPLMPRYLDGQTTTPIDGATVGFGGLMSDGAVNLLSMAAQGRASELAADVANKLNPLIKYPLELATGESLYHHRPLDSVYSNSLEHIGANSPLARYLSTAKKMANNTPPETKALDLLLGLKLHGKKKAPAVEPEPVVEENTTLRARIAKATKKSA